MKIRIYRTWSWQIACSPMEVRFGGSNPMKLVAHDKLQYLSIDHEWKDVEIVEEPQPPHPNSILKRSSI